MRSQQLAIIEPRLRTLLPADLYATVWLDPSTANLRGVFEHLRTLQRVLLDYIPRQVSESMPKPGEQRHGWQEGTLMFTDLAGFTKLMEANSARKHAGAEILLGLLNNYFSSMIEIISKSGGDLLEFTGDAVLARFRADRRRNDLSQAIRAGLRMQREMTRFEAIETDRGVFSLRMRVGIHTGRFLTADIGTPRRTAHVLLGSTVQDTKRAEGAAEVGRVSLTPDTYQRVCEQFRFEPGNEGHFMVVDDLTEAQLGEYDLNLTRRRASSPVLFDSSVTGLFTEIEQAIELVEPLASYLPAPILNLLVESAQRRKINPRFAEIVVLFINLVGLPEAADIARPEEEAGLVDAFSCAFALINATIEAREGVLKDVTYHLKGSNILAYFGVPNGHNDDPERAGSAALAVRDIVANLKRPICNGQPVEMYCQMGLAYGPVFAAEIGEPRGRREFNVLGDTVNTAARLMSHAEPDQILVTEHMHQGLADSCYCELLGQFSLKGKAAPVPIYTLTGIREEE